MPLDKTDYKRLKPGTRIRHSQALEGIDTGIIVVKDGALVLVVCEHPKEGRFDMEIYDTEVREILEEGLPIPMSPSRFNRTVALSLPETKQRKLARKEAKQQLAELEARGEAVKGEDGKWRLVA